MLILSTGTNGKACWENSNGTFHDECLNEYWFVSLAGAKAVIEASRVDYNTVRTPASLDPQTPAAYAASACARVQARV